MPRLLDLFCGAGGSAVGYHRAGFDEIVGVDIVPQPHYPFTFIQGDALQPPVRLEDFDLIHASPPCQHYSRSSRRWNGRADEHPDLVNETRSLLASSGQPWLIENVVGSPLNPSVVLCGSMFELGVRRHRLFEASFGLLSPPCHHQAQPRRYEIYDHGRWYLSSVAAVYGMGGGKAKADWSEAMGIDWMTNPEMVESIPPAYTEYLGRQFLDQLTRQG